MHNNSHMADLSHAVLMKFLQFVKTLLKPACCEQDTSSETKFLPTVKKMLKLGISEVALVSLLRPRFIV